MADPHSTSRRRIVTTTPTSDTTVPTKQPTVIAVAMLGGALPWPAF